MADELRATTSTDSQLDTGRSKCKYAGSVVDMPVDVIDYDPVAGGTP